jgi:glycosyltransferase involved in cell wall biosynthesis
VKNKSKINLVIDGNEANVVNRVGSNAYAFHILKHLEELTKQDNTFNVIVLLSNNKLLDLPKQRKGWRYKVIKPRFLWTQFAEPIWLWINKNKLDVFFTPGHYAPRLCPIPYLSSVMDLAFLYFPNQFHKSDLIQLKQWTKYSVKAAKKVIAISQHTKQDVIKHYFKNKKDVVVAYPAVSLNDSSVLLSQEKQFLKKLAIRKPYFLHVGTIQPRKNILQILSAFEMLCKKISNQQIVNRKVLLPQLVIAGKAGWLSKPIINKIKQSPFFDYIVFTDYFDDKFKKTLYSNSVATIMMGNYEGFGMPALEALYYGSIPIVAKKTSLPEVVGKAAYLVDHTNLDQITQALESILFISAKQKAIQRKKSREQLKKFSWEKSAFLILETIKKVALS